MKAQLQYETYMHLQNVLSFDLTSTSGTYKLSRSFVCFFIILYRRSLFVSFVFFSLIYDSKSINFQWKNLHNFTYVELILRNYSALHSLAYWLNL